MTENTPAQSGNPEAGEALAGALSPEVLDVLVKDAYANGGALGAQELLNRMTKAVLERSLETEMTHHLGYEKGDAAGNGSGNSRNGKSMKTVSTTNGPVEVSCRGTGMARSSPRSCRNGLAGSAIWTR